MDSPQKKSVSAKDIKEVERLTENLVSKVTDFLYAKVAELSKLIIALSSGAIGLLFAIDSQGMESINFLAKIAFGLFAFTIFAVFIGYLRTIIELNEILKSLVNKTPKKGFFSLTPN